MHTEPKVETTPTDRPIFGLPVDTSILFANHKGVYKPSIEKSKTKLLRKLGFLANFLDADEKIVFVTTGCSPYSTLEQLTMGSPLGHRAQTVLVRVHEQASAPHSHDLEIRLPRVHCADSVPGLPAAAGQRLRARGGVPQRQEETDSPVSRARTATIIKHFQFATGESDRRSENPQRNHLCPNLHRDSARPHRGMPLLRARIQEPGESPDAFRAPAGRRVLLHRASFPGDRRRPGRVLSRDSHPGESSSPDCSAMRRQWQPSRSFWRPGRSRSCSPSITRTASWKNSFRTDLKAFLSGRPVQRVQPEPPPIPAPPQPKHRPEDVLSLR